MRDRKAIATCIAITLYAAMFNIYIAVLTCNIFNSIDAKAIYYLATTGILLYIFINEYFFALSEKTIEWFFICKSVVVIEFILIMLTLFNILKNPIPCFITYNGAVIAVSAIILTSGLRHGEFKQHE